MTELHQFLPSFVDRDAIGSHVRHLHRVITGLGLRSEIYAWEWRGERSHATDYREFKSASPDDDTWILYHLSTASPIGEWLRDRPEHLAINYHNITPTELFAPWEPLIGIELDEARTQLVEIAKQSDFGVGVSRYNEQELQQAGCTRTAVAPILFDPQDFEHTLDRKLDSRLKRAKQNGGIDWLFVGRIAPHKAQHDVIKAFALYRQLYDDNARLHLVGGISSHQYWTALRRYIDTLGLKDSVSITQSVSNGALGAYYANADVFVCLSEHEGFGVPLLEAMYNRVPVLAFGSSAVHETLGYGGLALDDKSAAHVAAAVQRVTDDGVLRRELVEAGQARLADFSLVKTEDAWRAVIEEMLS